MSGLREVNIEAGMPTVDVAVRRMTFELHNAKRMDFSALRIIHGYGSSGKGGRLRIELRRYLERQRQQGLVKLIVPGEQLSIFDADARALLAACPEIRNLGDLERHNNGVTYILL